MFSKSKITFETIRANQNYESTGETTVIDDEATQAIQSSFITDVNIDQVVDFFEN